MPQLDVKDTGYSVKYVKAGEEKPADAGTASKVEEPKVAEPEVKQEVEQEGEKPAADVRKTARPRRSNKRKK